MGDVDTGSDAPETPEVQPGTQVDAKDGGETTTPEEVAQVLKGAGIDLPKEGETKDESEESDTGDESDSEVASEDNEEAGDSDDQADSETSEDLDTSEVDTSTTETTGEVNPDFTLQVEDASGVTHKIEKIEDLPEDFEPKNNRQIIEIISNLQKLEGDKAKYEADRTKAAEEAEHAKSVETIQEGWKSEFKDLNVNDEARREEVMQYMTKENNQRQKEGKPLIRTVEHALLGLEKQETKETADEKKKADKETARKNGGLVGGSSAPSSTQAPVYKSGTARNANEAIRKMGLIS